MAIALERQNKLLLLTDIIQLGFGAAVIHRDQTGLEFALIHERYPTLFIIQKQERKGPDYGKRHCRNLGSRDIDIGPFFLMLIDIILTLCFIFFSCSSPPNGYLLCSEWQYLYEPRCSNTSFESCCKSTFSVLWLK